MRWNSFPTAGNKRLWQTREMSRKVAAKLLDEKWSVVDPTAEKRDVMSLLGESLRDRSSLFTRARELMYLHSEVECDSEREVEDDETGSNWSDGVRYLLL